MIDGVAPAASHGFDVDFDGRRSVQSNGLYQLVRQAGPMGEHTFGIESIDPGVPFTPSHSDKMVSLLLETRASSMFGRAPYGGARHFLEGDRR